MGCCFFFSSIVSLGEELVMPARRSSEWIFRIAAHLHGDRDISADAQGKGLFSTAVPDGHRSVLEAYVIYLLRRLPSLSADQVLAAGMSDLAEDRQGAKGYSLQRFLYVGKQYHVLLEYCQRLRQYIEVPGSVRRRERLAVLVAESRLWQVMWAEEERGTVERSEEMLLKVCSEFEAAAPREDGAGKRLEYYMTVMKLMERAKRPRVSHSLKRLCYLCHLCVGCSYSCHDQNRFHCEVVCVEIVALSFSAGEAIIGFCWLLVIASPLSTCSWPSSLLCMLWRKRNATQKPRVCSAQTFSLAPWKVTNHAHSSTTTFS